MEIQKVSEIQNNQRKNYGRATAASCVGAAVGALSRYVVPTKNEFSAMFNKNGFDSFVSSGAAGLRSKNRSTLKYSGLGALVALGLSALHKVVKSHKSAVSDQEYTKLGALVDAPDYACAMMWYMG